MGVEIDKVVDINVPDEIIAERMAGRRVCLKCGASYHLAYKKPKVEGVCDSCGGELIQRKDDHADTVMTRLNVYHEQTEPLKGYYEEKNKLSVVNGQGEVGEITASVLKVLED